MKRVGESTESSGDFEGWSAHYVPRMLRFSLYFDRIVLKS